MDWLSEWLEPEYSDAEDGEITTEHAEGHFHIPFPRYKSYLQIVLSSHHQLQQRCNSWEFNLFQILQNQLHIVHDATAQCTEIISHLLITGIVRLSDLLRILEPIGIHETLHRPMCTFDLTENFARPETN
jgi:hypothetical protein